MNRVLGVCFLAKRPQHARSGKNSIELLRHCRHRAKKHGRFVGIEPHLRFSGYRGTMTPKPDISRTQVRKLYQSTNMVPKQLPEAGFNYSYDLEATPMEKRISIRGFD
jgi:hypothetical protein